MGCPAIMQWQWSPLLLLLVAVSQHALASEEVMLSITTKKAVHVCSQNFLSITVDPASLLFGPELGSRAVTALSMARELSPAYLRLAGHCTNRLTFHNDGMPDEIADNYTITERQWVSVAGFAQHAGLQLVVALPTRPRDGLDWDPRPVLEFITFCDRLRLPVAAWQLGYELQYERATAWQLGRDVLRLRRLLDAFPRYAGSQIVAPDVVRFRERADAEWLRSFLESAGSALSALTWHPQFVARAEDVHESQKRREDGEDEEDDSEGELYFPPDSLVWDREALNKALGRQGARLPLWIAESHSGESRGWFVDALQWAHKLGVATRAGAHVIFRQPDPRAFSTPTPEFWVSVLHKRLVGRTVLDSRLSGNRSHVHAFSACARPGSVPHGQGGVAVWAVNLLAHRVRLSVKASWGHPDKTLLLQYSLTAAGPHPLHSRKVLLNGEPLSLSSDGELPELQPRQRLLGRTPVLPLPARSVTFLVFPEANVRICQEEAAAAGPQHAVRQHSAEEEQVEEEEEEGEEEEEDYVEEEEGESDEEQGAPATRDKRKLCDKHHIAHEVEHELILKAKIPKEKLKHKLVKKKLHGKQHLLRAKAKEHLVQDGLEHEAVKHLAVKKLAKEGLKKHHLEGKAKLAKKELLREGKLKHVENEKRKRVHRVLHKKHHIAEPVVLVAEPHHHVELEHKLKQAELHHALEEAAHHKEHALIEAEKHHIVEEHVHHDPVVKHVKLVKPKKVFEKKLHLAKHAVHAAPVIHHEAPVIHHAAPVIHHEAPVIHHAAPVVHHEAPVVHHEVHKEEFVEVLHPVHEVEHHKLEEAELQHAEHAHVHHELTPKHKVHHHVHEPLHHQDKWRHYRDVDPRYHREALADAHDVVRHRKQAPKHYSTGDAPSGEEDEDEETTHYDYAHSPHKSLRYLKKKYGHKDKSRVSEQKPRIYKYSASPQSLHEHSDEDIRKDYYLKRKSYSRKESSSVPPPSSYSESGEHHYSAATPTSRSSDRQFTQTKTAQEHGTGQQIKHKFKPFEDFEETTTTEYGESTQAPNETDDQGVTETPDAENKTTDHIQAVNTYPWFLYKTYNSPNIHVIYQNTTTTSSPPVTHSSISPPENTTQTTETIVETTTAQTPHVAQDQLSTTVSPASETHAATTTPPSGEQLALIQVLDELSDQKSNERAARVPRHAPSSGPFVFPRPASEVGQSFAKTKSSLRRRKEEEMRLLKQKKKLRDSMRSSRRKDDSGPSLLYDPNRSVSYEDVDYLFGAAKQRPQKDDSFPRGDVYLREGESSEERNEDYDYVEPDSSEDQLQLSAKRGNPAVSIEDNDIDSPGYWQFFENVKVQTPRKKSKYSEFGELWEAESHGERLEAESEEDEDAKVVQEPAPTPEQDSKTKSSIAKILKLYFDKAQYMSNEKEMEDEYRKRKQKKKHYTDDDFSDEEEEEESEEEAEEEERDYFDVDEIDENLPSDEIDSKNQWYSSSGKTKSAHGRNKRSLKETQMSLTSHLENVKQQPKLNEKELEKMVDKIVAAVNKLDEESKSKLITLDINSDEDQTDSNSSTDGEDNSSYGARQRRSIASTEYDHDKKSKLGSESYHKVPGAKNALNKQNGQHKMHFKESLAEKDVSAMSPTSSSKSAGNTKSLNGMAESRSHKNHEVSSMHHLQSQFGRKQQKYKKTASENRHPQKSKNGKYERYNSKDISFDNSKKAPAMNTGKLSEIMKFNSKANLDRHVYVVQPYSHSPENSVKKDLKASYRVAPTKLRDPSSPENAMSADRGHELYTNPSDHKESSGPKSETGFGKKLATHSPKMFPNAQTSENAGNQHQHTRQRRSALDTKLETASTHHVEIPVGGSVALHRNLVGESGLLGETVYWEDGYRGSPSDLRFITDQEGPQMKFSDTGEYMALQDQHSHPEESSSQADMYRDETMTSAQPMVSGGASFVFEYVGDDEDLPVPLHGRVHPPEVNEGYNAHYHTNDFNIPASIDTIILPEELETVQNDFILPAEHPRNDKFYYKTSSNANANRIIAEYDPVSESESLSYIGTVSNRQPDHINKNGYPFRYTESNSGSGEYQILGVNDEVQKELNRILGGIKNVVIAERTSFEPIDDYFEDHHLRMHSNNKKVSRHKRSVSEYDEDDENQNNDEEIVERKPYKLDSRLSIVHDDQEEDDTTDELLFNDTVSMNEIDVDDDDSELIQRNLIRPPKKYKQTFLNSVKDLKSTSGTRRGDISKHGSKPKIPSGLSDVHSILDEALPNIDSDLNQQSSSHTQDVSAANEELIDKSELPTLEVSPQGSKQTHYDSSSSPSKGILGPIKTNSEGAERKTEVVSTTVSSTHSSPSSDETDAVPHDDKEDDGSKETSQETQQEEKKNFFQRIMAKINSAFKVMGAWMFPHKKQPSPSS